MKWDYIIIGTGIGGSTLGHSLAETGKTVLYLERGVAKPQTTGKFPEIDKSLFNQLKGEKLEILKQAGRCTEEAIDISHSSGGQRFIPLLGQGVGGSSLLYGAAMERFYPEDFRATQFFSKFKDSSTVDWPISYQDLAGYYEQAEKLYRVVGSVDPLRKAYQNKDLTAPIITPPGQKIFDLWSSKGFHPYRLPVGHTPHHQSECKGCQAFICGASEKSDAGTICVFPSLERKNVKLISECEVLRLNADADRVQEVVVKYNNEVLSFKGNTIVLAAGALHTPKILLQSKSNFWRQGLGNNSGLVGKNFSRHFMDLYMVSMDPLDGVDYFEKELALNDFYIYEGEKYGTVQSLGNPPNVNTILMEMYFEHYRSSNYFRKLYYQFVANFGYPIIKSLFRNNLCIAAIMDDVSYEDNFVGLAHDEQTIQVHYQMKEEGHQRLKNFRKLILNSFKPLKAQLHKQGENNQRLAHATGTCRMGEDRMKSVVDKNNKVHDLENLYIVDASFFPTGSGINPALTIAANALRVADILKK